MLSGAQTNRSWWTSIYTLGSLRSGGLNYRWNKRIKRWASAIKKLDIAMDGLKRIEKLTRPSYKNRNLEALALAVNTFSGEIIKQINQRNNNE